MNARSASHSRTAFSASVSKTGWRSNVDRPITLSSSLVAVCCSRATLSSLLRASSSVNRRTFSMAMTAWSAKVFSSSTCVSAKYPGIARAGRVFLLVAGIGEDIRDMNDSTVPERAGRHGLVVRSHRERATHGLHAFLGHAMEGHELDQLAVEPRYDADVSGTESFCTLSD